MAECPSPLIALEDTQPLRKPQEPAILNAVDEHAQFVTQLFERYRRSLLRYLTDLLARREDAEDVIQETYLRLISVRDLDRSGGRARAYEAPMLVPLLRVLIPQEGHLAATPTKLIVVDRYANVRRITEIVRELDR